MTTLQDIVGQKSYARLVKAKVASSMRLAAMKPEDVMAIAGIGPKKMKKLLAFIGKRGSEEGLRKTYNKLKFRRRFSNVVGRIRETVQNPKPFIEKAESVRKGATDVQNLMKAVYNIGRPEGQRLKESYYAPVTLNLDPERIGYEGAMNKLSMEFRLEKRDERYWVRYEVYNPVEGTSSQNEEPLDSAVLDDGTVQLFMEILQTAHDSFRRRSPDGIIIVVLDNGEPFLLDAMQKRYKREMDQEIFFINNTQRDYLTYNALVRYSDNPSFGRMIGRLHEFQLMYAFEKSREKDWDQYKQVTITDATEKPKDFLDEAQARGKSYIEIAGAEFGVLQAMTGLMNWQEQKPSEIHRTRDWDMDFPEGIAEFKKLRRMVPILIGGRSIKADHLAMVNHVLEGRFRVFEIPRRQMIFVSEEFPEIGFAFGGY